MMVPGILAALKHNPILEAWKWICSANKHRIAQTHTYTLCMAYVNSLE